MPSSGFGFYLCARKEVRTGRGGADFVSLVLQDVSGQIPGKIFDDVDALEAGVRGGGVREGAGAREPSPPEARTGRSRRSAASKPAHDRLDGFREEDCIPCAPRPIDEMWAELQARDRARREPVDAAIARARRWSDTATGCASGRPR